MAADRLLRMSAACELSWLPRRRLGGRAFSEDSGNVAPPCAGRIEVRYWLRVARELSAKLFFLTVKVRCKIAKFYIEPNC